MTIDDLEDGDDFICESGGRTGEWFVMTYGASDLSTSLRRGVTSIPGGRGESQRAIRLTGFGGLVGGALWFGVPLNAKAPEWEEAYDASGADGVRFWMKSTVPITVTLPTWETVRQGTCLDSEAGVDCDNPFSFEIDEVRGDAWRQYDVPFASLTQLLERGDDTGNLVLPSGAFQREHLLEVAFRISSPESFDVWIDDVSFYNCAGDACRPTCPVHSVSCRAVPGLAAGCWPAGTDCASLINKQLIAVWVSGPNDVWAADSDGEIVHWDGAWWSHVPAVTNSYNRLRFWGSGPSDVWAVGDRGAIIHWDGIRWSSVQSGTDVMLTDVWGSGPTDVWISGHDGTILHWDGSAVSTVRTEGTQTLDGIWGSAPDDVWAVGYPGGGLRAYSGGIIVHWDGVSWTEEPFAPDGNMLSIWGSGRDDVWAVGDQGVIVHWDGRGWSPAPSGVVDELFTSVWGSGRDDVWAVGAKGTMVHWNGLAWSIVAHVPQGLAGIWGSGPNDVWAVGAFGTFLRWDGTAWRPAPTEGLWY